MKLAIMQPTYLPWAGYFNLIAKADKFVFLDDVQFAARSWQQRNRIVLNGEEHMLSVPAYVKGRGEQLICDVQTDETQKWRLKHTATICRAYSRCPHGTVVSELVESVLSRESNSLANINIELIVSFCREMGLPCEFPRSSQLNLGGRKSGHLVEICRNFKVDTYLSAASSREYIEEERLFADAGISVLYQAFVPGSYPQPGGREFHSHMSIVDVVANLGFAAAQEYVSNNGF